MCSAIDLMLRVNRKEQDQFVSMDESIEAEEEKEEKKGPPEGKSSSTQHGGKHPKPPQQVPQALILQNEAIPGHESHNRHT
jgi:hypothetical protein